jgi:hypothetical protein
MVMYRLAVIFLMFGASDPCSTRERSFDP